MAYDMLLRRQFFIDAKIKLVYQKGEYYFECDDEVDGISEAVLSIYAIEEKDRFDQVESGLDEDLEWKDKSALLDVLCELDGMSVEPVDDGYCIRVNLKDSSLFRYAPRRMSVTERKEVDDIVRDLLERGIIRESISRKSL